MTGTQPARGMRDFLPADVRRREYVIAVVKDVYERYGFEPLETPAVENIETLMGKYGEEGNGLIFKILKRGEHESSGQADLALRYDLTVPLARVVAEYGASLPRVFRRYQIQPVWRADRPARGRFREFYQCDVDVAGVRSLVVEAELCAAVTDVLTRLGFTNFVINLNNRQLLTGLLNSVGFAAHHHAGALTALDKLDKIGRDGVREELIKRGLPDVASSTLLGLFAEIDHHAVNTFNVNFEKGMTPPEEEVVSWNSFILGQLKSAVGSDTEGIEGISELESVLGFADALGIRGKLILSPSLARGLSYYTGSIMEITVPDLRGSLGGGGRYDGLVGMFSGKQVPACGFSLGLERIIVVMTERGMFPENVERAAADALVTVWDEGSTADALALARLLRDEGVRTEVYAETGKIKNQLKYASTRGVRFVVLAGPDERARGEVSIKDLLTGEQQTIKREDAAARLAAV